MMDLMSLIKATDGMMEIFQSLAAHKRIFIDCGGHRGESALLAWKLFGDDIFVVTFEPNLANAKYYESEEFNLHKSNHLLCTVGVSSETSVQKFIHNVGGSTCFTSHPYLVGNINNFLKEEDLLCIDLTEWIETFLSEDQEIFLKLDVEGEEYPILHKLFDLDIVDKYFDKILLDFHAHRLLVRLDMGVACRNKEEELKYYKHAAEWNPWIMSRHNEVVLKLAECKADVSRWDALNQESMATSENVYFLLYDAAAGKFRRREWKLEKK